MLMYTQLAQLEAAQHERVCTLAKQLAHCVPPSGTAAAAVPPPPCMRTNTHDHKSTRTNTHDRRCTHTNHHHKSTHKHTYITIKTVAISAHIPISASTANKPQAAAANDVNELRPSA